MVLAVTTNLMLRMTMSLDNKPDGVNDSVPRLHCSKSCVDVTLQPLCRVAEEGMMVIYLWCMGCSKKGIKSEQAKLRTGKVAAVYFPEVLPILTLNHTIHRVISTHQ